MIVNAKCHGAQQTTDTAVGSVDDDDDEMCSQNLADNLLVGRETPKEEDNQGGSASGLKRTKPGGTTNTLQSRLCKFCFVQLV